MLSAYVRWMSVVEIGEPVVRAHELTKVYGDLRAVDRVSIKVQQGDGYGLLGPNGAGKTTFMRMLFGLIRPDSGDTHLWGIPVQPDPVAALSGVAGFVETPRFYPYLSGRANLELLGRLGGDGSRQRIDEVLDVVQLADRARDRVRGYSYGMVQRLRVAAALLPAPRLLDPHAHWSPTNPPTVSTRGASATCESWCAGWPPRASPSCCPATT